MFGGKCLFPSLFGRLSCAIRAALALVLLTLATQPALAAPGDTGAANAAADVAVVTPLSLIKMKDMKFGKIAARPVAGTVVINPVDSSCTTTGPILHVGTCQAAEFGGMGGKNMFMRINMPTSITLTGPGTAMVLDTFTLDTAPDLTLAPTGNGNGNGGKRYKIVSTGGIYNFNVGGTLHVNANQATGTYTGTFSITVVYQ